MTLRRIISEVFQRLQDGSTEMTTSQMQGLLMNRDMALKAQDSLKALATDEVGALIDAIEIIHNQLVSRL